MKIMDTEKPSGTGSNEGEYTTDDLECMLDHFIEAKRIESDPQKLAMLKDYAKSKNKMVEELFDVNKIPPPKSLKDLKDIYAKKVDEENAKEPSEEREA